MKRKMRKVENLKLRLIASLLQDKLMLQNFNPRYENPEISLHCGMMLRECIRHEPLARVLLHSEMFYSLFTYVEMSTFDIASDAFTTFKVLILYSILYLKYILVGYLGDLAHRNAILDFCHCMLLKNDLELGWFKPSALIISFLIGLPRHSQFQANGKLCPLFQVNH